MKHITALANVQRRATKLIPGYKELDYKERLKRLNLPPLSYRRFREDMIEIYKILTQTCHIFGMTIRIFDLKFCKNPYH